MDILERLADLIRPLIAWRAPADNPSAPPPKGSTGDGAFIVIPEMMSILGCSPDELGEVLKTLGFWNEKRPKKAAVKPPAPAAADAAPVEAETVTVEAVSGETPAAPESTAEVVASVEPVPETATAAPESRPSPSPASRWARVSPVLPSSASAS